LTFATCELGTSGRERQRIRTGRTVLPSNVEVTVSDCLDAAPSRRAGCADDTATDPHIANAAAVVDPPISRLSI
jgi:hypothetical protein